MSRYMDEKWSWIEGSHPMRDAMLDLLSDEELSFSLGGQTMPLGALFREMGEIEHSYVESLKTFKQDFDYRNTEAGLDSSVARLKAWFQSLDDEMKRILTQFSDEDFTKMVERPSGYSMPLEMQLDVYLQALLIFFGKATIYLKAMNKRLPKEVVEYIG